MAKSELHSHVQDMLKTLQNNPESKQVKEDELLDELEKFMEYGVPITQAKKTLIKKYGGQSSFKLQNTSDSSERKLISNLQGNENNVNILGHIISINPKEVNVKGKTKQIFYGIIGDESGTIPFTSWKDIDVEKGDVVKITNAYTKEWQGQAQLNFGERVEVTKTDKDELPDSTFEPKKCKVGDLKPGIGKVELSAKILEVNERTAEVDGEEKKVFSGIIGDETGKAQFTSWHDFGIKENDVVKINGGYVKSWKGIPQLTFDEKAELKKLDEEEIPLEEIGKKKMSLFKIEENQGGLDVEVEGRVIEIKPGSGFIKRCPECNRALKDDKCNIHGGVEGIPDLRIKLILDDGTGASTAVLNRELTEKIIDKDLEECKKIEEKKLNNQIKKKFYGKKILLRGNALLDNFGLTIIPKNVEILDVDISSEAEKLSKELEDLT
ncbi:MAG: hypothetical protein V5A68_07795 [Candidatus Thermoplasmatota archaeon]